MSDTARHSKPLRSRRSRIGGTNRREWTERPWTFTTQSELASIIAEAADGEHKNLVSLCESVLASKWSVQNHNNLLAFHNGFTSLNFAAYRLTLDGRHAAHPRQPHRHVWGRFGDFPTANRHAGGTIRPGKRVVRHPSRGRWRRLTVWNQQLRAMRPPGKRAACRPGRPKSCRSNAPWDASLY